MAKKKKKLSSKFQVWVDARERFKLSDAPLQMARELGLNPKKFGGMANHKQEPWKVALPDFIEELYFKRFGRERPETVRSIEQLLNEKKKRKEDKKNKAKQEEASADGGSENPF